MVEIADRSTFAGHPAFHMTRGPSASIFRISYQEHD